MATKQTNWLVEAMDSQGRKSSWLAEQLGVNRSRVSEWRAGLPIPDRHIGRIRELLGLNNVR